ncbi:E3 ubiquitin-ligase RNF170-like [Brachionus plicatilis]|uniref:E3 ubiquitin-protein ligase RNF170 n=1 Tax=Brachionus plicatilis TaxID=10195 RepID=A0A3M7QCA4_BRAPC|nr:E3 ubiquitin-ligase RNF170-like [Brachionus plicatilis]
MIIEGIDDSVFFVSLFLIFLIFYLSSKYLRIALFQVLQQNTQIHQDSINDVNQTRESLLNNRNRRMSNSSALPHLNCPICLNVSNLPIETSCGHIFCANCIIQYHRISNSLRINCPMCRQQVNYLLRLYSSEEQQRQQEQYGEVFATIGSYNRRNGGQPRSLLEYIYDVPILFRHLMNELFSYDGISLWYRIRIIFFLLVAFCYFLSPLDIIPEALFGIFGFLDDLFVIFIIAIYVSTIYRQFVTNRG